MADIQTELTHNNVTYLSDRENYMKIFKNRLYDLIEIPDAIYDRTISDAPLNADEIQRKEYAIEGFIDWYGSLVFDFHKNDDETKGAERSLKTMLSLYLRPEMSRNRDLREIQVLNNALLKLTEYNVPKELSNLLRRKR